MVNTAHQSGVLCFILYYVGFFFYCDELLAPRPIPKLEDHPLSAVRDSLLNICGYPPYLEENEYSNTLTKNSYKKTDECCLIRSFYDSPQQMFGRNSRPGNESTENNLKTGICIREGPDEIPRKRN
jgi:hypothetical protein